MEIQSIRGRGENIECSEFYEMVLCMIGKDLTTKMKADEAMLLSTLYESFVKKVYTESRKIHLTGSCSKKQNSPETVGFVTTLSSLRSNPYHHM